jgi:hypothetical protein
MAPLVLPGIVEELAKNAANESADSKLKEIPAFPVSELGKKAGIGETKVPKVEDGMVLTDGLIKATAGDIFANSTKGAKVISAGMGQLTNKLLSDTGAATPGAAITVQVNMGDLHEIHDVDGFVKRIGPAMEQLVRRIGFQENTRK